MYKRQVLPERNEPDVAQLSDARRRVEAACLVVSPDACRERITELEKETVTACFWDNAAAAQKVMTEMNAHKDDVALTERWDSLIADACVALEFAADEADVRLP